MALLDLKPLADIKISLRIPIIGLGVGLSFTVI